MLVDVRGSRPPDGAGVAAAGILRVGALGRLVFDALGRLPADALGRLPADALKAAGPEVVIFNFS